MITGTRCPAQIWPPRLSKSGWVPNASGTTRSSCAARGTEPCCTACTTIDYVLPQGSEKAATPAKGLVCAQVVCGGAKAASNSVRRPPWGRLAREQEVSVSTPVAAVSAITFRSPVVAPVLFLDDIMFSKIRRGHDLCGISFVCVSKMKMLARLKFG